MGNDNRKWLYDSLKRKGYNLGSYEEYESNISNAESKKWLYDNATKAGYKVGSFEEFDKAIGADASIANANKPSMQSTTVPWQQPQNYVEQSPVLGVSPTQSLTDAAMAANNEILNDTKATPITDKDGREYYPIKPAEVAMDEQRKSTPLVAPLDKQLDDRIAENSRKMELAKQKYEAERDRYKNEHPISSFLQEFGNASNVRGKSASVQGNFSHEMKVLQAEREELETARKTMEASRRNMATGDTFSNGVKEIGHGIADAASSLALYDYGLSGALYSGELLAIQQKQSRGEKLTDNEKEAVNNSALINEINQKHNGNLSSLYTAGQTTANMAPIVAEMVLSPASGLGKAASAYVAKSVGKSLAKKILPKVARAAGDIAGASAMTLTTGAARTADDAMERMSGDVETGVDTNGEIVGGEFNGGADALTSIYKATTANSIENFTEMAGGYFSPLLKGVGKLAGKGLKKAGLSKVTDLISDINSSEVAKIVSDFSEQTKWNGTLEEIGEEEAGIILNSFFVGDNKLSDLTDAKVQTDIALGVGLFGGFISGIKIAGYRTPHSRAKKALNEADAYASEVFGNDWAGVKGGLNEAEDEELSNSVSSVLMSSLSKEQKIALTNYAFTLKQVQGINLADVKQSVDNPEVLFESMASSGKVLPTPEEIGANKVDIYRNYKRAERNLNNLVPAEIIPQLDSVMDVELFAHDNNLNDNQAMAVADYLSAKQPFNQYVEQTNQHREETKALAKERAMADVEKISNPETGFVSQVKHKFSEAPVYLVGGQLSFGEDGLLDRDNSSPTVYYVNENGERQMANSEDFDRVLNETAIPDMITQAEMDAENDFVASEEESLRTPDIPAPTKGEVFMMNGSKYLVEGDNTDNPGQSIMAIKLNDEGEPNNPISQNNSLSQMPRKVLEDGRLAVPSAITENEVVYDVLDANGNIADSGMMPPEEFNSLTDYASEQEEELNDDGTLVNPLANNNLSENQPTNEIIPSAEENKTIENQPLAEETPIIPSDDKGNLLYHKAPVNVTIDSFYREELEPEEIDSFVQANKDASTKLLSTLGEKGPKIGTNIAKYKADKLAWKEKLSDAKEQVAYWNSVSEEVVASRVQPGDKTAEAILSMGEPMTGEELAATMLGTGRLPVLYDSYKKETGGRNTEARGMVGLFVSKANGGMTIEEAGEQLMLADQENGTNFFNQDDPNAGRNAIIDVLSGSRTRGDLFGYIKNNREVMAERERQAEYDAYSSWTEENFGMTPDDYESYEEQAPASVAERFKDFDEEEFYNNIANELNGEQGEIAGTTQGSEVLQREGFVSPERTETSHNEGTAVPTSTESGIPDGTISEEAPVANQGLGENENKSLNTDSNFISLPNDNQIVSKNNEVLESIPQGEHGALPEEDGRIEEALSECRRRSSQDERYAQADSGTLPEREQKEIENKAAEDYAKEKGSWIPMQDVFSLGVPAPSGNENDVYLDTKGNSVFKVNNLMNSGNITSLLERIKLHNEYFPQTKYELAGFSESGRGDVFPVLKQGYVENATEASPDEIGSYMQALGFSPTGEASYSNGDVTISDLHPRNVLKDADGEIYVINADFKKEASPFIDKTDSTESPKSLQENAVLLQDVTDSGNKQEKKSFIAPTLSEGEDVLSYASRIAESKQLFDAEQEVNSAPTEAQKEAGNYKKGHVKVDSYNISIENPKGSERSGMDTNGQPWSVTMNNSYGYIRETEGADGDHIDVFLSENPSSGNVFVVDQVKEDGSFDEHKVMYGFSSVDDAKEAYLSNYSPGWKGLGNITEVSKDEFKKWVDSSKKKTKAFAEYKNMAAEVESGKESIRFHLSDNNADVTEDKEAVDYNRAINLSNAFEEKYLGVGRAFVIKSNETLRKQLEAIGVPKSNITEIEEKVLSGKGLACYEPNTDRMILFNTSASDNTINGYLWHENTHRVISKLFEGNSEEILEPVYQWLNERHPESCRSVRNLYFADTEATQKEECIAWYFEQMYSKHGSERLEIIISDAVPQVKGVFEQIYNEIVYGREGIQSRTRRIWNDGSRIDEVSGTESSWMVHNSAFTELGEKKGENFRGENSNGGTVSTEARGIRFRLDENDLLSAYKKRIEEQNQKINLLERSISRYENQEEARDAVISIIKEQLSPGLVGVINKSEFNSLLLQVQKAKTLKSIERILINVKSIVLQAQQRKLQRTIDQLLSLKVQDINGKNMSIAKNVDDGTRKVFALIKGRVADIKISGYEDEMRYLKRENRDFQFSIKQMEIELSLANTSADRKAEIPSLVSSDKMTIEKNANRIKELRSVKEEVELAKLEAGDIDLEKEMEAMNEKLDKAARGEAVWTQGDNERMAALNITQSMTLCRGYDYEISNIENENLDAILANSDLYKSRINNQNESKRERINRAIRENRRQITARERLMNDARSMQVQQMQETIEQLNELISNGKNSLLHKAAQEATRKGSLIRKALKSVEGKPINWEAQDIKNEGQWKKFFSAPLGSFEYMCKRINTKTLGKDGFFYTHFVEGKEGTMEAYNTYLRGLKEAKDRMDSKSMEIFGKPLVNIVGNSDKVIQESGVHVFDTKFDGAGYGVKYEKALSKSQAMYVYMVWKMADGRTKLELQGFDEESISEIETFIGLDYMKYADWIQSEFLVDLREKYNEKYLEMFNTSMAQIKDYVPLRINQNSIYQESTLSEDKERKKTLEERAGSLINRVVNTNPVDISQSAFGVVIDHVNQMEEWNAYVRVRKDLDAVLSNTTFRNQLNTKTKGSFENFYDAATVATKVFHAEKSKFLDEPLGKLSKGIVGGNIAWRLNTALKQVLSAPAFFGYSQSPAFMGMLAKNTTKALPSFKWCMDNIPSFRERVSSGTAGNEKLDEKAFNKFMDKYIEYGMIPNKFVDAVTCSIGAKSIFDYKYQQLSKSLEKDGLNEEEKKNALESAKRLALMDADIYYNATQQSSHPVFMSPVQLSRTLADRMLTTYQNSNIGYVRKVMAAYYDLTRSFKWKEMMKTYTDMYMEQGMSEMDANSKARVRLLKENRKTAFDILLFGWGVNTLWNIGSQGLLGFFVGDGDDDKDKWTKNIGLLVTSPIKGMPGGNLLESLSQGYGMNPFLMYQELDNFARDSQKAIDEYGLISPELAYKILDITARLGGIDLEVWGNIYLGVEGMTGDGALGDDNMIDIMYMLNTPKSNRTEVAKVLYKDDPVLVFAEKIARASKYMPKKEPWEDWIPGIKPLNKRKENEIKKEHKRLHMSENDKKKEDEKMIAKKHLRKLKELEDDAEAQEEYIERHEEEHVIYEKYY